MPPKGYASATIFEETVGKLVETIEKNDTGNLPGAIDDAVDVVRDTEELSEGELAYPLCRRITELPQIEVVCSYCEKLLEYRCRMVLPYSRWKVYVGQYARRIAPLSVPNSTSRPFGQNCGPVDRESQEL